jgi:hypothetical protein
MYSFLLNGDPVTALLPPVVPLLKRGGDYTDLPGSNLGGTLAFSVHGGNIAAP